MRLGRRVLHINEKRLGMPDALSSPLSSSRGPGTAFGFALAIVDALNGKGKREEIEGPMLLPASL